MLKSKGKISRTSNMTGMEENTLAILDSNDSKDTRDANDDRMTYLEAVRAVSLVPENGIAPTNKMYEAVFRILRTGKTLDLIMSSYMLLTALDKRFPRVYLSTTASVGSCELNVIDEAWSPFVFGMEKTSSVKETAAEHYDGLFDSSGFSQLVQDLIGPAAHVTNTQLPDTEILKNMLLLQYLLHALEGDFGLRNKTMNWNLVRESSLNMILASRRINYKSFMKDCVSMVCRLHQTHALSSSIEPSKCSEGTLPENHDAAVEIGVAEIQKNTCIALKKLLIMIMELDASKKKADLDGLTSRGDGIRTPLLEIILDELTYNRAILSPFLQVFDNAKWKMEIILQYLSKYIAKPSVRTRRSNGPSSEDQTLIGVLKCFSNITSTRNVTKKIGSEAVQLLLGHAFQAYLGLLPQQQQDNNEQRDGNSLTDICDGVILALASLKKLDQKTEFVPFAKEAVFTAAVILSNNS